jgi:folate-binding protein YgfZ
VVAAPDPRLPALGYRCLVAGSVDEDAAAFAGWDRLRIGLGVPDGSRDMELGKAILLENNIDLLNGVAWDKGCYMGQELTARTRYRGLVKKRLTPVEIEGDIPEIGMPLIENGKEIGEMRSARGGAGLALLRLDRLRQGGAIPVDGAILRPKVPDHMISVVEAADA